MKKILLTGGSGFFAKEFVKNVSSDYAIKTLGRNKANDICCDLVTDKPSFTGTFDIIVHAAGKAHFNARTPLEEKDFFDVNLLGTSNLLAALEGCAVLPTSFVFISSVSVYGAQTGLFINEECPLNAQDPYGVSKIKAELAIIEWCQRHNVTCSILRLPLLVGSNPPGNLGNMIKGIKKGYYLNIAGGKAKKSMVLASDIATIIPSAAEIGGIYNLTDGYHPSFKELSNAIAEKFKRKAPINIPLRLAKTLAKLGDLIGPNSPFNTIKLHKILSDLTFDDEKARIHLGWKPSRVLDHLL